jgi:protein involved in polysaccharide export with SLBB domain
VIRRVALLGLAALAGCSSARITPVPHRAVEFQPWSDAAPAYRFAPGDKVRVQFLRTPEMNEVALVAPDGAIGLRAAGRVQAAGLTAEDLQAAVATAALRVLIAPVVTASLEEAGGSLVMVGGSVNRPGAYPLAGRRGALELILLAGGFDAEARMEEVVLIRRGPGDRPMVRTIDVRGFVQGGDTTGDVPVLPSDIVFVPRSRVAEANLWVDQNINRMLPFSRSFGYAINSGRVNGF